MIGNVVTFRSFLFLFRQASHRVVYRLRVLRPPFQLLRPVERSATKKKILRIKKKRERLWDSSKNGITRLSLTHPSLALRVPGSESCTFAGCIPFIHRMIPAAKLSKCKGVVNYIQCLQQVLEQPPCVALTVGNKDRGLVATAAATDGTQLFAEQPLHVVVSEGNDRVSAVDVYYCNSSSTFNFVPPPSSCLKIHIL